MSITQTLLELLVRYGYIGIFVFTFLETSMLFPFLPSEVAVPAIAAVAVSSMQGVLAFGLAGALGGTLGGLFAYRAFGTEGASAAEAYGGRINVSQAEIDRGRRLFNRWGQHSVFWGRFLPFVRSVVSVPAGFAGMNVVRFTVYTAVGTFLFNLAVAALLLYGKRQFDRLGFRHVATELLRIGGAYAASNPVAATLVAAIVVVAVGWGVRRMASFEV
ncbi:hypothetical protein C474_08032 [Halogeometricum pallidum JCM 14848]|uniref:VTT domain-containing protein n=1 Tax=Halogeometricum pallidum JCM 14848 TaxID=1227487 RepID=M0D854_HALPD|nr:VTT domain-containing protein [Halogeometricum pallidum]ELZ31656.1 hypothetical protein C474_08032 [Halogeometricum pallidum JCM 14848]